MVLVSHLVPCQMVGDLGGGLALPCTPRKSETLVFTIGEKGPQHKIFTSQSSLVPQAGNKSCAKPERKRVVAPMAGCICETNIQKSGVWTPRRAHPIWVKGTAFHHCDVENAFAQRSALAPSLILPDQKLKLKKMNAKATGYSCGLTNRV